MQKTEITNPFSWDKRDIEIVNEVKERVKTLPLLALPTPDHDEFVVQTDASEHQWGAVYLTISKFDKERKRRIYCYKSGTFSGTSQRYHIHEKELLAVIKSFEKMRFFLDQMSLLLRQIQCL